MRLNIALIQTDPQWESPEANLERARQMILQTDASLVVLPEMFNTGFSMNAPAIAEEPDGASAQWMQILSDETGKAIIGSIPVRVLSQGEYVYLNRLYVARPNVPFATYDKRHLFRMGGENDAYARGDRRLIIEWGGFRIMPVICYDLRFPVWLRNRGDYDVLIDVASWATPRRDVWLTLLKARSLENICYTVGVNRVGEDPDAHYSGDSIAYDFRGRTIAYAEGETEQVVNAVLDMEALEEFRQKFPVWKDADDFQLLGV